MKIIKLNSIDSTQLYLKNNLDKLINESKELLVITQNQTAGIGQRSNSWLSSDKSLTCSFVLTPNPTLTLTALEVAVIIKQYFQNTNLKLKWPNDLFINDKKCGGILMHTHKNYLIVGLGINLSNINNDYSFINTNLNLEVLAKEIYSYILTNRINDYKKLKTLYLNNCIHHNQIVEIENKKGKFIDISEYGEAIINIDGELKKFSSGPLRF